MKLIMQWDINPGMDQEYFEFVVREWVPTTSKIGLQTIGAWYTVYSREEDAPQILAEAITDDMESMQEVLSSTEWGELKNRLMEFVNNYSQKIVYATGGFQM